MMESCRQPKMAGPEPTRFIGSGSEPRDPLAAGSSRALPNLFKVTFFWGFPSPKKCTPINQS